MLSRTADHLYWMSRYTERAENTARMLNVSYETSMLPQSATAAAKAWQSVLSISELLPAYYERHGEITLDGVLHFMVRDETNTSSIYSCLLAARENARAVRGALTTEAWETLNMTWLDMGRWFKAKKFESDPARFFEWVKLRSHLSRGVVSGTMLQDDAFLFLRLGTFIERADNTARLLDVRFHAVKNDYHGSYQPGKGSLPSDFYHWSSILRSVSAFEVYRKVYRNVITPERVAEMLILRRDMPRSLHASMYEVVQILEAVGNDHSAETQRQAGLLLAELQYGRIDELLATGLHAFLVRFLERVHALGGRIGQDFLATTDPVPA
ncbi:alpha-E domain-containing protein [Comamonas piscis]|uniref:Alpha-E domain-containing protein n=1 Tax=Comamonas piscis TaxID=1562974 RepID=A0A7G5EG01_9BURK|nr:alpha-E domain-containing protein [Comamonas piscis]QMV72926.1 alpha-E domain-containing protein [Comamonas piscis]WSO35707.1 alpha-E domain-containing protein [Comamonas piscis]